MFWAWACICFDVVGVYSKKLVPFDEVLERAFCMANLTNQVSKKQKHVRQFLYFRNQFLLMVSNFNCNILTMYLKNLKGWAIFRNSIFSKVSDYLYRSVVLLSEVEAEMRNNLQQQKSMQKWCVDGYKHKSFFLTKYIKFLNTYPITFMTPQLFCNCLLCKFIIYWFIELNVPVFKNFVPNKFS